MTRSIKLSLLTGAAWLLLGNPIVARAAVQETFQFYGTCSDCVLTPGPLGQIADLVLMDYTQGSPIIFDNFVSLKYYGSNLVEPYEVLPDQILDNDGSRLISGSIGPNLPKREDFYVAFDDFLSFQTFKSGNWFTCDYNTNYNGYCTYINNDDQGIGQWSAPIPEPATYGLIALGLLGIYARRRTLKT